MLRQRLSNKDTNGSPYTTPRSHNLKSEIASPFILDEWKLALIGLIISSLIITVKISYNNRDALFDRKLMSYETWSGDGELMYEFAWKKVVKYSNIWFPLLCGALITYFTWIMVYLDSNVPGVQPPSPLSPSKYKTMSGHSFHLNYVFALLIGILVASYMYYRDYTIIY